jgi:pimeloyl-ACP methyl ester carboxylesterase
MPTVRLRSGRALAFGDYGSRVGHAVFALHGAFSCHQFFAMFDGLAAQRGLRLLAPDRPGQGGSDYDPTFSVETWPAIVAELASALQIEDFSMIAYSEGGLFASACALHIPHTKLRRVLIVSGLSDLRSLGDAPADRSIAFPQRAIDRAIFVLQTRLPWLWVPGRVACSLLCITLPSFAISVLLLALTWLLPASDGAVLRPSQVRAVLAADVKRATGSWGRSNFLGQLREACACSQQTCVGKDALRPAASAEHCRVVVWHGDSDNVVPPHMGKTAARILGGTFRLIEGAGHMWLLRNMPAALSALADDDFEGYVPGSVSL